VGASNNTGKNMFYPLHIGCFLTLIILWLFPVSALAQNDCGAPELSADQIHEIIKKERAIRADLPRAFPKYEYKVSREGCYYQYSETGLPSKPEYYLFFTLNQFGAIVEARGGLGMPLKIKCTEKVYSLSELTEIIKKARKMRPDLPPPFPYYIVQVEREGCMYFYFERELPEDSRNYTVFQIDPFGELKKSYRREITSRKSSGNSIHKR
jgi:hypothetical protein